MIKEVEDLQVSHLAQEVLLLRLLPTKNRQKVNITTTTKKTPAVL